MNLLSGRAREHHVPQDVVCAASSAARDAPETGRCVQGAHWGQWTDSLPVLDAVVEQRQSVRGSGVRQDRAVAERTGPHLCRAL